MSKRGVLLSTANHPRTIAKSHSAQTHPLPHHNPLPNPHAIATDQQQITENNLLSEEPERMVNQAYYTYQDPDSLPHHESDRS
jgi:hypothetical protein